MSDNLPQVRDARGLLVGFPYKFKSENEVDWRAIVPIKYLYLNPQKKSQIEKKYGKPINEIDLTTTTVDDSDLVITLAGIRYLLRVRGATSCIPTPVACSDSYAAVQCIIRFIPNMETNYQEVVHGDNACAHPGNTKSFGKQYLIEMASNRAMCRTVRSFLNIDIVSKEELGDADLNSNDSSNFAASTDLLLPILKDKMEKYGYTLDQIKKKLAGMAPDEVAKWNKIDDLPSKWVIWCIERIDQKSKTLKD